MGPLSGATTLGQSEPGSNGNEGVLRISQSSSIAGTSPSDCSVSYLGHSLGGSYPSAEKQSLYSTAPADWAKFPCDSKHEDIIEDIGSWLHCPTRFPKLLNLYWRLTILFLFRKQVCFFYKWIWILIFPEFSIPHALRWLF